MLVGGGVWAYHSYQSRHTSDNSLADWFKPLLLIVFGILLLAFPVPGIASLALFLSAYLLMDAYGSFSLAHTLYPAKGWGWVLFNSLTSLALALLFIIGWPANSIMLLGIFIGVSLLFDGWALIAVALAMKK